MKPYPAYKNSGIEWIREVLNLHSLCKKFHGDKIMPPEREMKAQLESAFKSKGQE